MRITIKFGGSVLNPDEIDVGIFEEIVEALRELKEEKHEILVVTGGGKTSRKYIDAGKKLGVPHKKLDQIGVTVTKLNARLLISALDDLADSEIPQNFDTAVRSTLKNKIPVMGGTKPGHTTDAVAAELAEISDSDLLIFFSDVDGVYSSDPKRDEEAEKIDRMTPSELSDLMSKMKFEPGMQSVVDPLAAEILEGMEIKTLVLGKEKIERLPRIAEGEDHDGTVIEPEEKDNYRTNR